MSHKTLNRERTKLLRALLQKGAKDNTVETLPAVKGQLPLLENPSKDQVLDWLRVEVARPQHYGRIIARLKAHPDELVLIAGLLNKNERDPVKQGVVQFLSHAAINGIDISSAANTLADAFTGLHGGGRNISHGAATALITAIKYSENKDAAAFALTFILDNRLRPLRRDITERLLGLAKNNDYEVKKALAKAIMKFMESKEFIKQRDQNSPLYIDVIEKIEEILKTMQTAMDKQDQHDAGIR